MAAGLGSIGVGATIAILVAGEVVLVPAAGIIAATLIPALVLGGCAVLGAGAVPAAAVLLPIALGSLAARYAAGSVTTRYKSSPQFATNSVAAPLRRGHLALPAGSCPRATLCPLQSTPVRSSPQKAK